MEVYLLGFLEESDISDIVGQLAPWDACLGFELRPGICYNE
jgi:hypothetical protein